MAQNTYRSQSNTPKNSAPKASRSSSDRFAWIHDRKFHLTVGWFLLLFSLFMLVACVSYFWTGKADQSVVDGFFDTEIKIAGKEVRNRLGISGAILSHLFIFNWFGIAALLLPPFLFNLGVSIVFRRRLFPIMRSLVFVSFYLLWISIITGHFVLYASKLTEWGYISGGIGFELAMLTDGLMGWGSLLFLFFLFFMFNMFFFDVTTIPGLHETKAFISDIAARFASKKVDKVEEESESAPADIHAVLAKVKQEVEEEDEENEDDSAQWIVKRQEPAKKPAQIPNEEITFTFDDIPEAPARKPEPERPAFVPPIIAPKPKLDTEGLDFEVEETEFDENPVFETENYDPTLDLGSYRYPTADLLIEYPPNDARVSKDELEANKDRIVETLINFKIGISSIKATIGPTVTLYEIVPEAGVKISRIKNLEDDIALSLSALGIRIIAPIPGRGTIGIEVPNKNKEMVDIRSVISTEKFMRSDKDLPIVLGKTISNEVYVTDLSKMPHLLIAGATGQGKSVGLNVVLTSLIYKKHPSQLKFVLVDPKKVELTLFNKLERHFLAKLPNSEEAIITDTHKVIYTLNSLCIEMDTRYDLLKDAACKHIKEYNKKFVTRRLNPNKGHRYLPYIVLVIDELADLMMTAGKEVEMPIARLAQLARAIGIHLILATQRPSVNVITGIIKANFPARLSFKVSSKIDSRTILDTGGAEQLIGQGDMLLSMNSEILRLQCAFVDTPEVEAICDFIGEQRGYSTAYLLPEFDGGEDEGSGIGEVDLSQRDPMFNDAARLIVRHQQGSTSLIQRKMKLGYNRAGRIIDQLEAAGIVGPFEGSKAREVLVQDEYILEQMLSSLDQQ